MSNHKTIHAICRISVAFVWFYHGLIPKLLFLHDDELAMNMSLGLSRLEAEQVSFMAGMLELIMSALVLLFWNRRWPFIITIASMVGLLSFVIFFNPMLLAGAFNPVTTNLTVTALSVIGLICLRQGPRAPLSKLNQVVQQSK